MAKYIVFSDSHGKNDRMYDIIRKNQDQIDGLFHLGDVVDAAEELSLMVKGLSGSRKLRHIFQPAHGKCVPSAWP